jgi:hypothetical protein
MLFEKDIAFDVMACGHHWSVYRFRLQRILPNSIRTPPTGQSSMFLDELGRLCLMDSRGTITYLVATPTPPVLEPPVEPPKLLEPPAPTPRTLWDHLKEDEPDKSLIT